jgi:hypothetical protein
MERTAGYKRPPRSPQRIRTGGERRTNAYTVAHADSERPTRPRASPRLESRVVAMARAVAAQHFAQVEMMCRVRISSLSTKSNGLAQRFPPLEQRIERIVQVGRPHRYFLAVQRLGPYAPHPL